MTTLPEDADFPEDDSGLALPEADDFVADDADDALTPLEPLRNRRSPEFQALQERIVKHVTAANYRPVKPKVIQGQLDLTPAQQRALRKAIRFLSRDGRLRYGSNHVVYPPEEQQPAAKAGNAPQATAAAKQIAAAEAITPEKYRHRRDIVVGVFRRTSRGTGYVRPTGTPRDRGRELDLFIPANKSHDASNGDTVAVKLSRRSGPGGRVAGEVAEILQRNTHRFVGVYDQRGGEGFVAIDGRVFGEPIAVGDASARNCRVGDKVVIEMVRFPSHAHRGEGVVVEVLGPRGEPGVDTLSIIREYDLPGEFPEDVVDDARRQADKFDESLDGRHDFTGDTVVTIDPVDARDFDDAISLEQQPSGHWLLAVHIADVSHFVPEKTPLDREARERSTSVYLPDRVIPMLPEIISNHLASLQPGKVRYTQTCLIEFTAEGVPVHAEVQRGAIRSARRFTYEEIDSYLADPMAWRDQLAPAVWELVARMHQLAMILRRRRLEHGAIELTLPEIKIDLDERGEVAGAHRVENTVSHQIIEEFMLAANEAVARLLAARDVPFLRRVHGQPDLRKLQTLTTFVRELGIECDSLESRFEIKRVIAAVAGQPQEHAVNYAVLRSMQKAVYAPDDEGHYALRSENYCHFTSPIRRYPDLTIHRLLNRLSSGQPLRGDHAAVALLGEHCSEREQRAADAERELVKIKLLTYLQHRIGTKIEAIVTGVEEFGLFAQGVKLPAEGLIPIQSLADDYFHFDRATHSLVGRRKGNDFRLGDRVLVEIFHVDVDRRELDLRLLKRLGSAKHQPGEAGGHEAPPPFPDPPLSRHAGKTAGKGTGTGKRNFGSERFAVESSAGFGKPSKSHKKKKQRPGKRERQEKKKRKE
jgi:ribonuclease R